MAYFGDGPWRDGGFWSPGRFQQNFKSKSKMWKSGEDFLQNTFHFPSFAYLPHENSVEGGYWKQSFSGTFNPICTWFLMAEITNNRESQIPILRNRVDVRDRAGQENIPIFFYPEDGDFDFKTLKKGSTVLVTNGQKHNFLDSSIGLRIEHLDTVSVAPCSMRDLQLLSKLYHERKDARCWWCEASSPTTTSPTDPSVAGAATAADGGLKKCSACKVARYCSKDCQVKHWKEEHKRSCKAVPIFQKLAAIDYTEYDNSSFLRLVPDP